MLPVGFLPAIKQVSTGDGQLSNGSDQQQDRDGADRPEHYGTRSPNAASPARSCAIAAEDISDRENAVPIVFFI